MTRLALIGAALLLSASAAAVPMNFAHQGRLMDQLGAPLDGLEVVTFRIYDVPSGGTAIWEETHLSLAFTDGYFSVDLGSVTPLDSSAFDGDTKYFAIQVGSGAEIPDRVDLISVPYAMLAGSAEGVVDGAVINASEIQINGSTVIDSSGQVDAGSLSASSDTLLDLGCTSGEVAQHDGSAWGCVTFTSTHDAGDIVTGTLSAGRLPVGTGSGDVAAGDHVHTAADVGALPTGTTAADIGALPVGATAADVGALAATGGTITGDLDVTGLVGLGVDSGTTCDSAAEGSIRWTGSEFEGCTDAGWVFLGGKPKGSDQANPGISCKTIYDQFPGLNDGLYWLDPNGGSTSDAFEAYCFMTGDYPGATLAVRRPGSVAGQENIAGDLNLPCTPSDTYCKLSDAKINALRQTSVATDAYVINSFKGASGSPFCRSYVRQSCAWISNGAAGGGCENSVNRNSGAYCSRSQTTASYRGSDGHTCGNLTYPGVTSPNNPFVIFEHAGGTHYCGGWDTTWDHIYLMIH